LACGNRTLGFGRNGTDGGWIQAERGARGPPPNFFLVLGLFRRGERCLPRRGAGETMSVFVAALRARGLEHTGWLYAPGGKGGWPEIMLPEVLSYDPKTPGGPSRTAGRTLTDDAVDAFLALLTNGKVGGAIRLGPHGDLLAEFSLLRAAATTAEG